MKKQKNKLILCTALFYVFMIFILFYLFFKTIDSYEVLEGIVVDKKKILFLTDGKTYEKIKAKPFVYYQGEKTKCKFEKIKEEEKQIYFYIIIEKTIEEKKKISISFPVDKKNLWTILTENWRLN